MLDQLRHLWTTKLGYSQACLLSECHTGQRLDSESPSMRARKVEVSTSEFFFRDVDIPSDLAKTQESIINFNVSKMISLDLRDELDLKAARNYGPQNGINKKV